MGNLAVYCETVHHLIESQRHQYVGKVNYFFVKAIAKKRSQIIQEILEATLNYYPTNVEENQFSIDVSQAIDTFFLTDHCTEIDGEQSNDHKNYSSKEFKTLEITRNIGGQAGTKHSSVVPITRKNRNSIVMRKADIDELEEVGKEANLLLDDERPETELVPSYSHPVPTFKSSGSKLGNMTENNPIVFASIAIASIIFLRRVSGLAVTVDLDVLLLFLWAAFCIGLHTPRPMISGIDKNYGPPPMTSQSSPRSKGKGRKLLKKKKSKRMLFASGSSSHGRLGSLGSLGNLGNLDSKSDVDDDESDEDNEDIMNELELQSPLPIFPAGAKLGSHMNCWSQPYCNNFSVRGRNYLKDRVKIESADFLWPVRGVDLFLTDNCPENVGRIAGIMGGRLREVPTFIINFRLPWGVLLAYFEIPELYIPFIKAGHDLDFDKSTLSSMDNMTSGQRCVARFCQISPEEKDKILKIVPAVADGPWVVKSVVGNKPAILGTKMPVNWIYKEKEDGKAMYFEADLDIVSSAAARSILSMVRSYTNVLTMDLGFVVQGNQEDELPEQMLCGTRLHGLDPSSAPAFPVSQDNFNSNMKLAEPDSDDEM